MGLGLSATDTGGKSILVFSWDKCRINQLCASRVIPLPCCYIDNEHPSDWPVGFCSLLSESRCDRWSQTSSSSSLSPYRGLRNGGQIQEPWTDRSHLGLDIILFTYAPGLVTAAFLQHETFKTWFQAYLSRNERVSERNKLRYVMKHHFHTVQDTVGVNTKDGVEITRHCGLYVRQHMVRLREY